MACCLAGCTKKEAEVGTAELIAHAGAGLHTSTAPYHDNSIEAITYALSYSDIQGVEVDVQFSANGTPWLFHDDELATETNGEGCIRSRTDEYLSSISYTGLQKGTLTRLDEISSVISGKKVFLDLRNTNFCTSDSIPFTVVFAALQSNQLALNSATVAVIVNDATWAPSIKTLGWNVYLNVYSPSELMSNSHVEVLTGCSIRSEDISKQEITSLQNNGKAVILFDVRSPKGIRNALKKNSNWLFVDDIRTALIEKYP